MKNYFKPSERLIKIVLGGVLDSSPISLDFKEKYTKEVEKKFREGLATLCYSPENSEKTEVKLLNKNKKFEGFFGLRLEIYTHEGFYPFKNPETKGKIFLNLLMIYMIGLRKKFQILRDGIM